MNVYEIIKRPIVTEKAVAMQAVNQYVFEVDPRASKTQIKQAVEQLFRVKVRRVRTTSAAAKKRRAWRNRGEVTKSGAQKKAVVTVVAGQKIELFEGA